MDSLPLGVSTYTQDFLSAISDILDDRNELVFTLDRAYHLIDYNPSFYDIYSKATGATPTSGMYVFHTSLGQELIDRWKGRFTDVFKSGKKTSFTGGVFYVGKSSAFDDVTLYPIRNTEGVVTKVAAVTIDISEKLLAQQKQERESEQMFNMELYRTLATQTPNFGIVIFDKDYRFLLCEGSALTGAGINRGQFEGRTMFETMEQPVIDLLKPRYDQALAGEYVKFDFASGDRDYNTQIFPVKRDGGAVVRGMIIINDVTDIKRAERILEDANKKLEEEVRIRTQQYEESYKEIKAINQYLDDFVHSAAHDLRSPILNLKTIWYLLETMQDAKEREMLYSRIPELVNGVGDTLDGLIRMVELQKKDQLAVTLLSLEEVMKNAIKFFEERIRKQRAEITYHFDNHLQVWYPEPRLRSIFYNLLSNALKYAYLDRKPSIHISANLIGEYVLLEFRDNGIGIDLEKHKDNLFKPFKRFAGENFTGAGLGLSLVKSIVEKNGGFIEAESSLNEYTIFKVWLKPYNQQ